MMTTTTTALTTEELQKLKTHGWKWAKADAEGNLSTDTVGPECIRDVTPTPDGFVVHYNTFAVFRTTVAVVDRVEWPDDLEKTWIFVFWRELKDDRRPSPEVN
jgi:hypothetical protein